MKKQRNTRQRQLVLDVVLARSDHPTADQVYADARAIDEKISRGTVYRNLHTLAARGDILQVKLPDVDRYEELADRHYHIICTECGAVYDAPIPYDDTLDRRASEISGCDIKRHRTTFEGRCPECKQRCE
ncbi:MAG: Fur family transcriptional regulator [Anaerovoracaceae bacterium]|jgi:Fur family ferric uptake transcriptional regulator